MIPGTFFFNLTSIFVERTLYVDSSGIILCASGSSSIEYVDPLGNFAAKESYMNHFSTQSTYLYPNLTESS